MNIDTELMDLIRTLALIENDLRAVANSPIDDAPAGWFADRMLYKHFGLVV